MSNEIDWTKPLEAYHPDSNVSHTVTGCFDDMNYLFKADRYFGGCRLFYNDGVSYESESKWRIRNHNRTEKPALTEEMVREAFSGDTAADVIHFLKVYDILPDSDDADLVMAREVASEVGFEVHCADWAEQCVRGEWDDHGLVQSALTAIKRVRAEKG